MKSPLYLCMALGVAASVFGEDEPAASTAQAGAPVAAVATTQHPPAKLDELLGPIALYPDALVALILPASTVPSDVVLAARYLADGGDAAKLDEQPWDDSVKALARYPDIIEWMDKNLAWTKQMGEAFLVQPADVMNSVQRLRKKAQSTGALVDTPQQKVVVEDENIVIVPADPEVIYVPYYDPQVVYVQRVRYVSDPWLSFGIGYSTGFWLGYGLDWRYHRVWCVDPVYRERYWRDRHTHYHAHYHNRPGYSPRPDYRHDAHYHAWRPRPGYPRGPRHDDHHASRPPREISRPAPFPRDVHRSTVTGNTNVRAAVDNGSSPDRRSRTMPHRSTAASTSTSVTPADSPQINLPTGVNNSPRPAPGSRPSSRQERVERNRPPQSVPRPDHSARPQPQASQSQPRPERIAPPATGRTGMPPPRENRPAPAPVNVERPQGFTPRPAPAPQPVREQRSVDENRRTPEREER